MLKVISNKIDYDFSSTQINFSPELSKRLKKWGYTNISASDVYEDEDIKGRESDTHVTVKYGLHTNDPEDVRDAIRGFGSFSIELDKVSRFVNPDKPFDVVKIEIHSDRLHELYSLLGEKLENSDEWPEYRPHATFAYIKKGTCRELSGDDEFLGEKVQVGKIIFSPKSGDRISIEL